MKKARHFTVSVFVLLSVFVLGLSGQVTTARLPVGLGQKFGSHLPRFLDALVGGGDTSSLVIMESGLLYSVSSQHTTLPVAGPTPGPTYAQFSGPDYAIGSVIRTANGVYLLTPAQVAEFSVPPAFQLGNAGRNVFRKPWFNEWDTSLGKKFRIAEGHVISFRAEAYSVLNHPIFGLPPANLNINTPSTFGKFFSTQGAQVAGSSARTIAIGDAVRILINALAIHSRRSSH